MENTALRLSDMLPLTCSRAGSCCHGNKVLLNPWELASLAGAKGISARQFRDTYTEWNGLRLKFNGASGYLGKQACSQYITGQGCSVHVARPLACRLFPLGRQIQNGETIYIHQGTTFPCLEGCDEVLNLPYLKVSDYLIEQKTHELEIAQNNYLELVQLLADLAFDFLLDPALIQSGDKNSLKQWRQMANESTEELAERIGKEWLNALTVPSVESVNMSPQLFYDHHVQQIQQLLQTSFNSIQTISELSRAAVKVMALALFLSVGVGAEPQLLVNLWIETARLNGAQE